MASEVEICNAALIKLGDENVITALGQNGREGETCELMYPQIRDRLLADHPWNFAIGRSTLIQDTSSPDFEFDNQFHLPSTFLRGLKLYDTAEKWKIEGNKLVTNASIANLMFIQKITDPGKFSPLFTEALSTTLAAEMAEVITGSTTKATKLLKEADIKLKEAKRRDGQEGTPDNFQTDVFTTYKNTKQWW